MDPGTKPEEVIALAENFVILLKEDLSSQFSQVMWLTFIQAFGMKTMPLIVYGIFIELQDFHSRCEQNCALLLYLM